MFQNTNFKILIMVSTI